MKNVAILGKSNVERKLATLSQRKLDLVAGRETGKLNTLLSDKKCPSGFFLLFIKDKPKYLPFFLWLILFKFLIKIE
jgi:hypothetical protein